MGKAPLRLTASGVVIMGEGNDVLIGQSMQQRQCWT
jgi:hypothetical protein